MKEKVRHKRPHSSRSLLRFWPASFRNSLSSAHQSDFTFDIDINANNMERDSLDRSSSELAVDPVSFNTPAPNSGNGQALGEDSPKIQQFPGSANNPSPAVDSVLQSDVSSVLAVVRYTY